MSNGSTHGGPVGSGALARAPGHDEVRELSRRLFVGQDPAPRLEFPPIEGRGVAHPATIARFEHLGPQDRAIQRAAQLLAERERADVQVGSPNVFTHSPHGNVDGRGRRGRPVTRQEPAPVAIVAHKTSSRVSPCRCQSTENLMCIMSVAPEPRTPALKFVCPFCECYVASRVLETRWTRRRRECLDCLGTFGTREIVLGLVRVVVGLPTCGPRPRAPRLRPTSCRRPLRKFECPRCCTLVRSRVVCTRLERRHRRCLDCGHSFATVETVVRRHHEVHHRFRGPRDTQGSRGR